MLAYVLHSKIANIERIPAPVERDIVTGARRVFYSVNGGAIETGLLVHDARPNAPLSGVISVPSLLGATLIGMRIGQRPSLLCEGGVILSIMVVDVAAAT